MEEKDVRRNTSTLAMPISGIKIANQIAGCILLLRAGYKPDLILGTSGGCITGTMLLACGISRIVDEESMKEFEYELQDILDDVNSANYCKPWIAMPIINTIYSMACDSFYDAGTGAVFIDPDKIDLHDEPEMWMGTFNKTKHRAEFFCTKSKKEALLQIESGIYTNEDVETIIKVATASSAVPSLARPVCIGKDLYVDGGKKYASPLGFCLNSFEENGISYHVVYVSPIRFSSKDDPTDEELEDDDIWNKVKAGIHGMVTCMHVPDRNNGIRHVFRYAESQGIEYVNKSVGRGFNVLQDALAKQKTSAASFIEIAPTNCVTVNFTSMKKGDLTAAVRESYKEDFTIRHWYV